MKESFWRRWLSFWKSRRLSIREIFSRTLYNSHIFVLLDEVVKYFFDLVAVFSHSRCLPLRGIFISWSMANFCQKSSQLRSRRYFNEKRRFFAVFAGYQLRGNLESCKMNTTPIIFISHLMANFCRKSSQLNSERQFEHCPHNLVLYIYVPWKSNNAVWILP